MIQWPGGLGARGWRRSEPKVATTASGPVPLVFRLSAHLVSFECVLCCDTRMLSKLLPALAMRLSHSSIPPPVVRLTIFGAGFPRMGGLFTCWSLWGAVQRAPKVHHFSPRPRRPFPRSECCACSQRSASEQLKRRGGAYEYLETEVCSQGAVPSRSGGASPNHIRLSRTTEIFGKSVGLGTTIDMVSPNASAALGGKGEGEGPPPGAGPPDVTTATGLGLEGSFSMAVHRLTGQPPRSRINVDVRKCVKVLKGDDHCRSP